MAFNTKAKDNYKAQPCGRNLVTLKAILIALGLIIAATSFAIAIFKVAKKADDKDDLSDDDHSASSELRCVTKINDQDILKGFWI